LTKMKPGVAIHIAQPSPLLRWYVATSCLVSLIEAGTPPLRHVNRPRSAFTSPIPWDGNFGRQGGADSVLQWSCTRAICSAFGCPPSLRSLGARGFFPSALALPDASRRGAVRDHSNYKRSFRTGHARTVADLRASGGNDPENPRKTDQEQGKGYPDMEKQLDELVARDDARAEAAADQDELDNDEGSRIKTSARGERSARGQRAHDRTRENNGKSDDEIPLQKLLRKCRRLVQTGDMSSVRSSAKSLRSALSQMETVSIFPAFVAASPLAPPRVLSLPNFGVSARLVSTARFSAQFQNLSLSVCEPVIQILWSSTCSCSTESA